MNTRNSFSGARAKLRKWRKKNKHTLRTVATACGLESPSIVCEWEGGGRAPSYESALAIERATEGEVSVEDWGFDRATARRVA